MIMGIILIIFLGWGQEYAPYLYFDDENHIVHLMTKINDNLVFDCYEDENFNIYIIFKFFTY